MCILLALCFFQDSIRPVHTYSIVAIDHEAGEMGVAVQSHWFSVGGVVPWAQSGAGVVATQSLAEPSYGYRGLKMMAAGKSAIAVLDQLTQEDEHAAVRQVAMIDARGHVASFTGNGCIAEAGYKKGTHYSVQANIMDKNTVWEAMGNAFETTKGPLVDRMMASLEAAQAEGGDLRGMQSAALLVVKIQSSGNPWKDKVYDLRIEDHPQPIKELKRLIHVAKAYHHMDQGDVHMTNQNMQAAMESYGKAMAMMPEHAEIQFWTAATMASSGDPNQALTLFQGAFEKDPNLKRLIPRLIEVNLFPNEPELLKKLNLGE